MNYLQNFKPEVLALDGYHLKAYDCPVKLNQNESPFDVPETLKDEILNTVRNKPWSRYPEPMPMDLVNAFANHVGADPDGILVSNGSNTLVQLILGVISAPNADVVIPSPSFSLYGMYTNVFSGNVISVPLTADYRFDVPAIQKAIQGENVRLAILCSPNNPTGCSISNDELDTLLSNTNALVMVDEAYGEFYNQTAIDLLPKHPNLIILKTFSKAFGAAGVRMGYLIAHPSVRNEIIKGKIPFDINVFSHTAALAILKQKDLINERIGFICAERDRVYQALTQMEGVTAYPSDANLLLFEVDDPNAVFDGLIEQGVLIRNVTSYPMLNKALRVSIGTEEENDQFLSALERTLKESANRRIDE
ncbi:MAG: histidinol-phosphate transaminase, partial [Candidatus Latescibacteria bacterium]|nr:histidinol-phosphate transaminase [Candidatus Latescibacterota bacterium]